MGVPSDLGAINLRFWRETSPLLFSLLRDLFVKRIHTGRRESRQIFPLLGSVHQRIRATSTSIWEGSLPWVYSIVLMTVSDNMIHRGESNILNPFQDRDSVPSSVHPSIRKVRRGKRGRPRRVPSHSRTFDFAFAYAYPDKFHSAHTSEFDIDQNPTMTHIPFPDHFSASSSMSQLATRIHKTPRSSEPKKKKRTSHSSPLHLSNNTASIHSPNTCSSRCKPNSTF